MVFGFQIVDKMVAILLFSIGNQKFWLVYTWTKKIYFAYINWSQLAKSLVFQWSGLLENRTKWRPSCFWTIGTQNFKIFGIPLCLVFQCFVFKPPLYLLICLSGRNFLLIPNISGLGELNELKFFWDIFAKNACL